MTIAFLTTGDEIMCGDLIDTNSAFVAKGLADLGLRINTMYSTGDSVQELSQALKYLSSRHKVLIVNGGLGPTVDDHTVEAICDAFHLGTQTHPDALKHLKEWISHKKSTLNKSNLKQTILPEGASIIPNPVGSAVGFSLSVNDHYIYCTPGVPRELKAIWSQWLMPRMSELFMIGNFNTILFRTFGIGESVLQEKLDQEVFFSKTNITLGFRASWPYVDIKLTITNQSDADEQKEAGKIISKLFHDYIIAEEPLSLAETVSREIKKLKKTIAFAESCTGGRLSSSIVSIPGASEIFSLGMVTYSNEMKYCELGVSETKLKQYGAVSEEVASEMLVGILQRGKSDYGIAVSGILGPDGGTAMKPVGTVCLAWGTLDDICTKTILLKAERYRASVLTTAIALDTIRRYVLGISGQVPNVYDYRNLYLI